MKHTIKAVAIEANTVQYKLLILSILAGFYNGHQIHHVTFSIRVMKLLSVETVVGMSSTLRVTVTF